MDDLGLFIVDDVDLIGFTKRSITRICIGDAEGFRGGLQIHCYMKLKFEKVGCDMSNQLRHVLPKNALIRGSPIGSPVI